MSDFTFKQLQEEVQTWQEYNFGTHDAIDPLLGAVEELGELAHAHLKESQGIRGHPEALQLEARDAVADCIVYLTDYCSVRGWDLDEIMRETWDQVKQRDWKKYPMTGRPPE